MIELLQFRHSPYNEKVRWALDLKRVPHRRRSLLPGPHMGVVKKLTGRTQTPVLVLDDGSAIAGSGRILDWLEQRHPAPRLTPDTPAEREQALVIQRHFDDDITPRIRRTVLDALLRRPRFFAAVFAEAESPLKQRLYSLIVPLAAPMVRKGNGITGAAAVADGIAAAHEALDFVAAQAKGTGYLVGDRFGIADITAATALATVVRPDNSPMQSPQPVDPLFAELIAPFREHPGAQWVRDIYARHRVASADFEGPSPY
ncbi:MAG: glutathione S-transferase [Sterolibacteriaceae bacterium]|nr:glutathione S-transferase [Sterolibacteriaceae bacterium]